MKKFFLLSAVLASNILVASQNVQVTGIGNTYELAKQDAIQKALMRSCKSAVVSDQEFRNKVTTRTKVIVYNGCLVKNFTTDDEKESDGTYKVTITAEVIQNHIPDRIINNHQEWFFYDFSQHQDRINQLKIRINSAKNLINEVFIDFPYSAFNLEHSRYHITYTQASGYLNVDYKLSWNNNFINSMNDIFTFLQDGKPSFLKPSKENIKIERPYVSNTFGFDTRFVPSIVESNINKNRPVIRLQVADINGRNQLDVCYPVRHYAKLYDVNKMYWTTFKSVGYATDTIQVKVPDSIDENSTIKMDVTTESFCKAFA